MKIKPEELEFIRSHTMDDLDMLCKMFDVGKTTIRNIIKYSHRLTQGRRFADKKTISDIFISEYEKKYSEIPEMKYLNQREYVLLTVPKKLKFYQIDNKHLYTEGDFRVFLKYNL